MYSKLSQDYVSSPEVSNLPPEVFKFLISLVAHSDDIGVVRAEFKDLRGNVVRGWDPQPTNAQLEGYLHYLDPELRGIKTPNKICHCFEFGGELYVALGKMEILRNGVPDKGIRHGPDNRTDIHNLPYGWMFSPEIDKWQKTTPFRKLMRMYRDICVPPYSEIYKPRARGLRAGIRELWATHKDFQWWHDYFCLARDSKDVVSQKRLAYLCKPTTVKKLLSIRMGSNG